MRPFYVRHRDDEYIDEVSIKTAGGAEIHAGIVPRYKTSGLSGDEWRMHVAVRFSLPGRAVFETGLRDFDAFAVALPWHFMDKGTDLEEGDGTPRPFTRTHVRLYRKGHQLFVRDYPAITMAVMAFGWLWLTWREQDGFKWLDDEIDHALCFQPGCADKATTEYQLKSRFSREGYERRCEGHHDDDRRCFCARHARRGDCGLEDADRNYIVLSGDGPIGARGFDEDVSESVTFVMRADALLEPTRPDDGGDR